MMRSRPHGTRPVRVFSYAGGRADEAPRSFEVDGVLTEVQTIVRRWIEEDRSGRSRMRCYMVSGSDGLTVTLCRDETTGAWHLA